MDIYALKDRKQPISMVTCYDAWSARILSQTDIDMILVGDSLAMVIYGHDSTLPIDTNTMALHTQAVKKGAGDKFIVTDLPFMSIHKGLGVAMNNVEQLVKAGAMAVKIEGAFGNEEVIRRIIQSGVPVMGHLGLTPQSIHHFGGFKVQGRTSNEKQHIKEQVKILEGLGCFAIVLECIPRNLAKEITAQCTIPTIGIGAGQGVDGQVLVLHDLLGMHKDFHPKFLRTYLKGYDLLFQAVCQFDQDVKSKKYPSDAECYK